jgi:hypothetical protein
LEGLAQVALADSLEPTSRTGMRLSPSWQRLYPGNRNVRPKIRQQLQMLRDRGWLEFTGRGRYRLRGVV